MRLRDWLVKVQLSKLKISLPFLEMEWEPRDVDRAAAWDMYVELLTRITTQRLPAGTGDEKTALDSIYSLFGTTREILRRHGRGAERFAQIAIVVLNQIIRPFTARWHRLSLAGAFGDAPQCVVFRTELESLQRDLRHYMGALADLAQVEDLTDLQPEG